MKYKLTAILMLTLLAALNLFAQSTRGVLAGKVVDSRGVAIRGARVVLFFNGKVALRETTSNESGEFGFDYLLPGDYGLSVEADGLTQSGGVQPVRIAGGQEFRIVIPLTPAAIEDSVIVSATRTESRSGETPAGAYVISATDLLRAQRINVFDALRASPGVAVAQTSRRGGVTSLFVRGGESDYTKVLIDGVPANDAGGAFDFSDLTADNAARVELVRGAQSAIYGSDAMAGVLQFFTHRGATPTPELEFAAEGGSFAFNRQFARLSGARGPFDYSFGFTHLRTDGRTRNDDYQNRVMTMNLGYRLTSRTQLRGTVRNENAGVGVPGPIARLFADPDQRERRRRIVTSLKLDDQTTARWHQSLSFVFAENNRLSFDPAAQDLTKPNTPLDTAFAFNDFANLFNNHQRRRGLRYQTELILPHSHLLSAGLDYEQERAVFDNGFTGQNRVAPDRTNAGLFLQDQFTLTPQLLVTAGIRVENNRADVPADLSGILTRLGSAPYSGTVGFGTEILPKLAAMYVLPTSDLQSVIGQARLKANYGHGIKAPSLVEAFSPNQFFLGNPALKPERGRSYDFGVEQFFWKDRYRVELTYFENRFRDQIAFVGNPATFGGPIKTADGRLTNFINNDRTIARGIELAISMSPYKRRLFINGTYTLLKSKLQSAADVIDFNTNTLTPNREIGLALLRRPRNSGTLNVMWIGDRFELNLDGFFVGRRRDGDPVTFARFDAGGRPISNKSYQRVDLAGNYRFTSRVAMFARIENLLNQDYEEVLGFPAYRLNFSAGMRFRIGGGK
ncbi:MAG TPA: TonB-dependent receptor [Blastocatellia bacterium]|nr:TonB-dependent receptor [Blastocatellia bacterium]HMZ18924.1 TonB-dependent receptor [Blastocatellia bacterium]HNG29095.1 TonB-dependent receptor [Blastocatellia bacterium]